MNNEMKIKCFCRGEKKISSSCLASERKEYNLELGKFMHDYSS